MTSTTAKAYLLVSLNSAFFHRFWEHRKGRYQNPTIRHYLHFACHELHNASKPLDNGPMMRNMIMQHAGRIGLNLPRSRECVRLFK
jgi:hypothetical protein